jgi:uncharacterized protein
MQSTSSPRSAAEQAQAPAMANAQSSGPWWKYKLVWMVWAGPALVVVASVVSFGLAAGKSDEVVSTSGAHLTPARTARNHAATSREVPAAPVRRESSSAGR